VDRQNFNLPGYGQMNQQLQDLYAGKDSMSQERLRQNTAANMAQQQSMAAGAAPGNQAAAHLAAMQNSARINQGMTGQATQLGIGERQAAMQGMLGLNQAQQQGGMAYEGNRTARSGAQMQQPTKGEQLLGMGMGAAQMYATGGVPMADGGVVTQPTHILAGEAGPEVVIPLHKLPDVLQQMQAQRGTGMSRTKTSYPDRPTYVPQQVRPALTPPPPPPAPLGQGMPRRVLPGEQAK